MRRSGTWSRTRGRRGSGRPRGGTNRSRCRRTCSRRGRCRFHSGYRRRSCWGCCTRGRSRTCRRSRSGRGNRRRRFCRHRCWRYGCRGRRRRGRGFRRYSRRRSWGGCRTHTSRFRRHILRFFFRFGLCFRRRFRVRYSLEMRADLLRDIRGNRTRVRLLFGYTVPGQQVNNCFRLDLQLAGQLINPDLVCV